MISGHSYLPNDRDFGSIQKANWKTQHVFLPDDWCTLIENAHHKNPFVVTKMTTSDFFSIGNVKSQISSQLYLKVVTGKNTHSIQT